MKISQQKMAALRRESQKHVRAQLPASLHRKIKSEAALRGIKLSDLVMEACVVWAVDNGLVEATR